MKSLMTIAALTALIASPAFAATAKPTTNVRATATQAYAAAPYATVRDSSAVVVDGRVIGRDPDPNIRLQIERDAHLPNAD